MWLFSVNYNGIGMHSAEKKKVKQMIKIRKTCGLIISSSDARWNEKNNVMIINKLKFVKKNVVTNNSHSREVVEEGRFFLKGE